MRTKLILVLVVVCIAGGAFVAGVLVERNFPTLFSSGPKRPTLLSPVHDAVLPNGELRTGKSTQWEFTWSELPGAGRHQIVVEHPTYRTLIDLEVFEPRYRHVWRGLSYNEEILHGWSWKVRSEVRGQWSDWSEKRTFSIERPGK